MSTALELEQIEALDGRHDREGPEANARTLLSSLFALFKLGKLYDLGNEAFPPVLARVLGALEALGGAARLHLLPEGTFVGATLLDRDPAMVERARFLHATLAPVGVTEIVLGAGTSAENLLDLVGTLQRIWLRESGAEAPSLDGTSFGRVRLRRASEALTAEATERQDAERGLHAFELATVLVQHLAAELARGHQPSLCGAKRLLHDLIEPPPVRRAVLLALTWYPPGPGGQSEHLVGTAVVALALAGHLRATGLALPRAAQLRIGLSALLHDLAPRERPPGESLEVDAAHQLLRGVRVLLRYRGKSRDATERVLAAYEHGALATGAELPHGVGLTSALVAAAHLVDALGRPGEGRPGLLPHEAVRVAADSLVGTPGAPVAGLLVEALGDHPPGSVVETTEGPALVVLPPSPLEPPDRPTVRPIEAGPRLGAPIDLGATRVRILAGLDPAWLGVHPARLLLPS